MKPCTIPRESVALLASSALSDTEAGPIREHLLVCPACRDYFAELTAICTAHSGAAQALPAMEVRAQIYHRVASAIRSSTPAPKANWLAALRMGPLPFAGAAALLLVCLGGWALLRPAPGKTQAHVASVPSVPSVSRPEPALAAVGGPKFLAYRLALNRSPEAFEQMLTAEEARPFYNAGAPMLRTLARSEADF